MDQKHELVYRDPFSLVIHPLHKEIPPPDKKSADWVAFCDSIRAGGILHPLIITKDGRIMDGERRWVAAKDLQLPEIPCIVRNEWEVGVIIAETLIHRKLMTRGAAVYTVMPLLKDFLESAESRRLANLRRGVKTREIPNKSPKSSTLYFGSNDELCASWGISQGTLYRAKEVHDLFHNPKCEHLIKLYADAKVRVPAVDKLLVKQRELKAEFEPQLLSGEKNLWNVLSGVGGRIGTEGQPRADLQLEFVFKKSLSALVKFRSAAEAREAVRAYVATAEPVELERLEQLVDVIESEMQNHATDLKKARVA